MQACVRGGGDAIFPERATKTSTIVAARQGEHWIHAGWKGRAGRRIAPASRQCPYHACISTSRQSRGRPSSHREQISSPKGQARWGTTPTWIAGRMDVNSGPAWEREAHHGATHAATDLLIEPPAWIGEIPKATIAGNTPPAMRHDCACAPRHKAAGLVLSCPPALQWQQRRAGRGGGKHAKSRGANSFTLMAPGVLLGAGNLKHRARHNAGPR